MKLGFFTVVLQSYYSPEIENLFYYFFSFISVSSLSWKIEYSNDLETNGSLSLLRLHLFGLAGSLEQYFPWMELGVKVPLQWLL